MPLARRQAKRLHISTVPLEKTNLVEASAGTGKTYAIAALYLRLLLEKGLSVQQILVVTYTKAATAELRDRIRGRIRETLLALQTGEYGEEPFVQELLAQIDQAGEREQAIHKLTLALQEFDEAAIFTMHGFCQRVLTEHAFESHETFDAEILTDEGALIQSIAEDYWRTHCSGLSSLYTDFLLSHPASYSLNLLCRLAQTCTNHHDIVVEPKAHDLQSQDMEQAKVRSDELEATYTTIFQEAQTLWKQDASKVRDILWNRPPLNKRTYNDKAVAGLLAALESLLTANHASLTLPKKFHLVTTSHMQTACIKNSTPPTHALFDVCQRLQETHTQLVATFHNQVTLLKAGFPAYLTRQLAERKHKGNVYGYGDMLVRVRNALCDSTSRLRNVLCSTYTAALIDEFQDTDPIQYHIFSTLFQTPRHILFLIGDPKQAIYGFRGADIFTYMQAANKVDAAYTLDTNWRSEPHLLQAVNHLLGRLSHPFIFEQIPFEPVQPAPEPRASLTLHQGIRAFFDNEFPDRPDLAASCTQAGNSPLHLWFLSQESLAPTSKKGIPKERAARCLAQGIAAEASRLVRMGQEGLATLGKDKVPVEPRHLAVLVRTNNQAVMVQQALRACHLPCVIAGSGNVFHTQEAVELLRVMEGIARCGTPSRVKAALTTRLLGLDGSGLLALEQDEEQWDRMLTNMVTMREQWVQHGCMGVFSAMISRWKVRSRLLGMVNGERRLTNILHLVELLHTAEQQQGLDLSGLLVWFTTQCQQTGQQHEEHQLRLESDEKAVQIVTIHKSKGLEYPIVFCPFLFDGVGKMSHVMVHDPITHTNVLDMNDPLPPERREQALREILAENMRLAYVALTRAKSRCYLACGVVGSSELSAMSYLFGKGSLDGGDGIQQLAAAWKDTDNEEMWHILKRLEDEGEGCAVYPMPDQAGKLLSLGDAEQQPHLELPALTRSIHQDCGISSFSSLVRGREYRAGYDESLPAAREVFPDPSDSLAGEKGSIAQEDSLFAFPKGPGPGSMLHEILEHLACVCEDSEDSARLIREKLKRYGMDETWLPVLLEAMRQITGTDLGYGFTLRDVGETLQEMEFYYPLKEIRSHGLAQFYREWGQTLPASFPASMQGLRFAPRQGFMLGFIDLVFRHDNRWYLVDWKSNHLGNSLAAYHKDKLTQAMSDNLYFFQSHIYTIALNAYLKTRLPHAYNYQEHFGGILYLFLRGMNRECGPEYGIYAEKPDVAFIDALSGYIMG